MPAALVQPGLTVLAQLLEPGAGPVATFPADGTPRPVDVRKVPPLRVVLVPVEHNGVVGHVEGRGRTREDWVALFRRLYPVGEVIVSVAPPMRAEVDMSPDPGTWGRLLDQLERLRESNGDTLRAYYMGVIRHGHTGGTSGLGNTPSRASPCRGWGSAGDVESPGRWNFQGAFAHEMGHLLGCLHTPVGTHSHLDPDYPHPVGGIGVWGLDLQPKSMRLKSPGEFTDVMGYGGKAWISDYTWRRG